MENELTEQANIPAGAAPEVAAKEPICTMRHPHTGDTVKVFEQKEIAPLMYRGYKKVN